MENEIDLLEIARKLWRGRRIIIVAGVAAALVGVVVALVSPVKYTARCVMVPQTGAQQSNQLGGLAAMAGLSMGGGAQNGEVIAPVVYPQIIASIPFLKELAQTRVDIAERPEPVTLLDYFADTTRMKKPLREVTVHEGVEPLTARENIALRTLKKVLSLNVDAKEGVITLNAVMPEAVAAAEVAVTAQQMLQRYITAFKIQKVGATLDFIEGRTEEARKEYEAAQSALAQFSDRNRNIVTQTGQIQGQRLENDYQLAYGVYSGLLEQREQARIKLKETTPVFAIIEPVTVPTVRSAPRRTMIVGVAGVLGGLLGCALALLFPRLRRER